MLVIRLSRVGRKNDPSFRVVLQEKQRAPSGKAVEYLGSYNARLKQKSFKADRIKYWISEGAQVSDTVHNLLVDEKIIELAKRKASTTKTSQSKADSPVDGKAEEKATVEEEVAPEKTEVPEDIKKEDAPAEEEFKEKVSPEEKKEIKGETKEEMKKGV